MSLLNRKDGYNAKEQMGMLRSVTGNGPSQYIYESPGTFREDLNGWQMMLKVDEEWSGGTCSCGLS